MTVYQAQQLGIENFSLLVSHVRVPPAIEAIMTSPSCRVQAFLAAGHVCTRDGHRRVPRRWPSASGCRSWSPASSRWTSSRASGAPSASWRTGRHERRERLPAGGARRGQPGRHAPCSRTSSRSTDRAWRGIGVIPDSGWRLSEKYRDVRRRAPLRASTASTPRSRRVCRSGEVLQGLLKPHECEAFGTLCTPRTPLGATMVSSEGACAAYYLYRRLGLRVARRRDRRVRGGEPRWLSSRPIDACRARLRGLDLPAAAARQPQGRDGPRRRRRDVGRAGRAHLPARRSATRRSAPARRLRRARRWAAPGWRSPPTRSWCGRCSSPAAASATSRSTAPSTTWR